MSVLVRRGFVVYWLSWMLTFSALGHSMGNLANTYSALGRHQEALVMQEETLEFQLRVLPENHPDICATWLCGVLIEVQIDVLCSR